MIIAGIKEAPRMNGKLTATGEASSFGGLDPIKGGWVSGNVITGGGF